MSTLNLNTSCVVNTPAIGDSYLQVDDISHDPVPFNLQGPPPEAVGPSAPKVMAGAPAGTPAQVTASATHTVVNTPAIGDSYLQVDD